MRNGEIKLRLWNMDKKEMIYPSIEFNEKYVVQLNCNYVGEFNGKAYNSVNMPAMLYLGIKDSKGNEIYRGDIIRVHEEVYQVKFGHLHMSDTCFYLETPNGSSYHIRGMEIYGEVIGNIYETPELLQQ